MRKQVVVLAIIFSIFSVAAPSCTRVEMAEGEVAELSMTWTCIYRVGKALSCPAKAVSNFKGQVGKVANNALGTNSNALASAVVSNGVGIAVNSLIPPQAGAAISCLEIGGDGICNLVRLANLDKITVSGPPVKRATKHKIILHRHANRAIKAPKNLAPGTYTITVSGAVLNQGSSSSSSSSRSNNYYE